MCLRPPYRPTHEQHAEHKRVRKGTAARARALPDSRPVLARYLAGKRAGMQERGAGGAGGSGRGRTRRRSYSSQLGLKRVGTRADESSRRRARARGVRDSVCRRRVVQGRLLATKRHVVSSSAAAVHALWPAAVHAMWRLRLVKHPAVEDICERTSFVYCRFTIHTREICARFAYACTGVYVCIHERTRARAHTHTHKHNTHSPSQSASSSSS